MELKKLGEEIVQNVGGIENIQGLTHCATRLRFNLIDDTKADKSKLEGLEKVVGVVNQGGQFQVIIGNEVKKVYQVIEQNFQLNSSVNESSKVDKSPIVKVLDTIAGIFVPIVPALTGAGMLKALLALLVMMKWVEASSQTYQILNFIGDAAFYFLPVLLANSAAKKFGCNQYVAITIGGILLHPTFTTLIQNARTNRTSLELFGLPVTLANYGSSVIPIILAVWFISYVEPFADRVSPGAVRMFMSPLLTLLIIAPVTLIIIGPLGVFLGDGLGIIINILNTYASWLVPLLVGAFTPLLVMTGMHYGFIPLGINMLATTGFDTVSGPGMMVSNIAQGGAALAVAFRTKKLETKQLAISTGISAVAGITEPALYGVNLRYKKPLISAMIGGGIAGLFLGIMGVGRYAQVAPGLFALPSFFGGDSINNFIYAVISCGIAFVVSFVASLILGIEDKQEVEKKDSIDIKYSNDVLLAPVMGTVVDLKDVPDQVFSSGALGKGVAFEPIDGKIYSPVSGKISATFPSNHAIGIVSENGAEVLIHVGLDTVTLNGEGFKTYVTTNQAVSKGDLLLEVDLEVIKSHHLNPITMMVVTNSQEFKDVSVNNHGNVNQNDAIVRIESFE
ncbi:PTS glucose transporter subunit IIA [Enterococcus cecorum]|uniref:PTS system sucrose-specific EIIBCA component n=1 Tax=Enterococcus cecorum TaxID=44008 RepID=A0A1Y4R007_9ENTE|nr:beta-glucoside-specific PTS transporter subunit IIABC [Enterococcus cecorum]OUQ10914.1 PTS beta-glucoside transporter subunit EIIBCA [Enterococcus cecorum]CAI3273116.1 PTS glucose transporter subunit IIA [Enterococcus cecorum]CAI3281386.1 PTS glucose transporter subunit IIA [Enterococcus cecorum]CAI3283028.1 PTS glucose transporter subunit IIA [Enterococcus cecorum]CAI3295511.1 PTS glucose transporter subunit IIA [Enterococcus cecorum]